MEERLVNVTYCIDVGSIAGGNFGWARITDEQRGAEAVHGDVAEQLRNQLRRDVVDPASHVSIGFESPLFVPLRDQPRRLTAARGRFEHSSFAGGPGSAVLVTGLVQLAYVLEGLQSAVATSQSVFAREPSERLFVWEAFVSGSADPAPNCAGGRHTPHACDAIAAATAAHSWLTGDRPEWARVVGPSEFVDAARGLDLVLAATGAPAIIENVAQWDAAIVQTAKPIGHRASVTAAAV